MTELLLACGAVMLASLSGKLLVWRSTGNLIERNLHLMVSFAGGVFLIFAWQLGNEVFEHMGALSGVLWILGGALAITLVCKLLPHKHSEAEGGHHAAHPHLDAHRMLASDSIHNAGDGILLAASFAAGPVFGFAATASVLVHEVVQEIAEFFVLRDAGYSVRRALTLNFAVSATILVGALGGWLVLELFETLEGPLLAVAAGGVLSVVFYDLLPHSVEDARTRTGVLRHVFWFFVGAMLMLTITAIVPHEEHHHGDEHAHGPASVLHG